MCFSSSNINNCFWITKYFTWIFKEEQVVCNVVVKRIYKVELYTLNRLEKINFSLLCNVKSKFGWMVPILCQLQFNCGFTVADGPTNDIKTCFFVEKKLFWMLISLNLCSWTVQNSHPNIWFVTSFWKMDSPKTTKENQQNHKKLEQIHNLRSGTRLSQTEPQFYLLIVVVKCSFTHIIIIFSINRLSCTLNLSKINFE